MEQITPEAVNLRGYFKYDSGGPYRVWTITRDLPELRLDAAWQEDVTGPPHAVAGDELWEDREDRGRVFRLKRDDLVVSRPEWWQVGDMVFGGTWPAWRGRGSRVGLVEFLSTGEGGPGRRICWRMLAPLPLSIPIHEFRTAQLLPVEAGDVLIEEYPYGHNGKPSYWIRVVRNGLVIGNMKSEEGGAILLGLAVGGVLAPGHELKEFGATRWIVWRVTRAAAGFDAGVEIGRSLAGKWGWRKPGADTFGKWSELVQPPCDLFAADRVARVPDLDRAVASLGLCGLVRVSVDVPGTRIRAGDLIAARVANREPPACYRGTLRALTVEEHHAVRALCGGESRGALQFEHVQGANNDALDIIADSRKWGLRRKEPWRPSLFHWSIPSEPIIEPIQAESDDAAIFELVMRTGCRLASSD